MRRCATPDSPSAPIRATPGMIARGERCGEAIIAGPTSRPPSPMNLDRVPAGKDAPERLQRDHRDPDARRSDQVRGRQGDGRGVRRPLHVDVDALSVQLRLHPADAVRRRRSVRRAGALAGAAHHRRRRALPADRHAQDGRRGGRRREDPRGADRQAVRPLPRRSSRRATCPRSRRSRSRISSSTTRTSSPASGCASSSWVEAAEAKQEIMDGIARYEAAMPKRSSACGVTESIASRDLRRRAAATTRCRRRPRGSTST